MLIHHDRHLRAVAAHRGEHLIDRRRPGHVRQRPGVARGDGLIRDQVPQHFLDVQAADDVIEVAAVDGIACVRLRADDRPQLVWLGADRYADQQHARHHGLARRCGRRTRRGRAAADLTRRAAAPLPRSPAR